MPSPKYDNLYDRLKPPERLTLLVEAMARDDAAEAGRLHATCPRGSYTGPQAAFYGRLTMAFDTVAVITIDLRCMWGKLHMLHWVMGQVLPQVATALHITAALSFIDGESCGRGEPQIHFFARPLPGPKQDGAEGAEGDATDGDEDPDVPEEEDDGEDDEQREWSPQDIERGRRLEAVQKRAECFTAGGIFALTLAAKQTAQELVNTWEAFGVFCRTRVGVAPETMLRAWEFPVAGDFEQTLRRYAHLKPEREKVKEYASYICKHWDERFGKRRDTEAVEDGGEIMDDEGGRDGD